MACWIILSSTVEIPSGRLLPSGFGISTLRTGEGAYVPSKRFERILGHNSRKVSGNCSTVMDHRFQGHPCWPAPVSRHDGRSLPIKYTPVDDPLKTVLPQRACTLLLHSDSLYAQGSWIPPFRLMFSPSPCPGHYPRHLATMTSAGLMGFTHPAGCPADSRLTLFDPTPSPAMFPC